MPFKDISSIEIWRPFCSAEQNHLCNFGRGNPEEQFCEIILNLDLWYRKRCCFGPFFSEAEPFVHFNRGYPEKRFSEIILNLDLQLKRRSCFYISDLELW